MSLTLYYSPTSPFARKVRIAAIELGLNNELELIALNPFEAGADYWAVNPLSKIPSLVTRDGFVLPDSRLILDYLRTLGDALEADGANDWANRKRQQLADGVIDAAVSANLEQRREAQRISKHWFERQLAAVRRALAFLEAEAGQLRTSGRITVAEISVASALGYLDLRLSNSLDWRSESVQLASWFATISQRPAVRDTVPPV
ncbi:glutathione S-transferase N-terminal domain-containing protein [Hydrocarboniphaga effusa]|jgi:glutathione S-transferase|uniref:glutathione S-transferase N-terminal domain-containing protein n=1 Tax=Hydrocarboniphaga effusa TaxID=243629 RepID=UPI003137F56F